MCGSNQEHRGGFSWESEEEGPAKQTRSEVQEKGEDGDEGWMDGRTEERMKDKEEEKHRMKKGKGGKGGRAEGGGAGKEEKIVRHISKE